MILRVGAATGHGHAWTVALLDRAADWLRDDPKRRRVAGLWADRVGHALADLLDALADVAGLDTAVLWQARVLLGEQTASATTRRTDNGA